MVLRDPESAQQQDSTSEQPVDGREDQQNSSIFRGQQQECIGWRREDRQEKVSGIVGAKDHHDEQAPERSVHHLRQQKVYQHRGHPEEQERYHPTRQQHHQVYLEEQDQSSRSAQVDRSLSIRKQYALKSESSISSSSSQYSQPALLEKAREIADEDHGESIRVAVYKEEEEAEEEAEEDYDYDTKYEMEMLTGANFAQSSSSSRGSKSRQGHRSPETRDIRQGENSVTTNNAIFLCLKFVSLLVIFCFVAIKFFGF